jgi:hypothetical protein
VNRPTMTHVQPFEATRPMVNAGVLAVNPWKEASGLDPISANLMGGSVCL